MDKLAPMSEQVEKVAAQVAEAASLAQDVAALKDAAGRIQPGLSGTAVRGIDAMGRPDGAYSSPSLPISMNEMTSE